MDPDVVHQLRQTYLSEGIVKICRDHFPALPTPEDVKMLGDEIIEIALSGSDKANRMDSTTEIIQVAVGGLSPSHPDCVIERRQTLTRLENFVAGHPDWNSLCRTDGILSEIVGLVCSDSNYNAVSGEEHEKWCLYKEKLNLKPAGGTGFAPHFDNPSLQAVGLCDIFITLMIAIDDMTKENGCLRIARGNWSSEIEGSMCEEALIDATANPDGNGRRGAIRPDVAEKLLWEDIECKRGDVYIFSGWIPHRSGVNATQLPRRAVFLTYNSPEEGDLREDYYRLMRLWRANYEKIAKA